ncbi:DNA-binding protein [Stenotrophomonas maltophilia]|uniref:helix-turn-helix domain-containing protein n=1 Tax=Stenotrophomonas pavanii TaxID=487698 RepID=UPI0012AFD198|nr:DNA-binding protein [Stenotrophomonas maltophilia]QGL96912.1 helix-turn-helix domain-containing protein [Stenotrophomonas maltophilia]
MSPALLTVDQAAQQLSLHPKTVLRHIRSGQLRATRIGKSYRITAEDLDMFTGTVREPSAARPQMTTVVDIPGCGAARAADLVRALHARVTGREADDEPLRMETIYSPEHDVLKLIVIGGLAGSTALLVSLQRLLQDRSA